MSLLITDENVWWAGVMGHIRPGVSDATARAVVEWPACGCGSGDVAPEANEHLPQIDLRDGSQGQFTQQERFARPMAVLLTMVGFVLLLACANIANLMLGAWSAATTGDCGTYGAWRKPCSDCAADGVESCCWRQSVEWAGCWLGTLGSNLLPKLTENAWQRGQIHIHFD